MKRYRFWHRWFRREVFVEIKNTVALSVNKGLRWFRAHTQLICLIILIIVSLLFSASLIYAWWLQPAQLDQTITCQQHFGPLQERNGYLEIQLAEHHPSEPVFSGKLFFISVDPSNTGVSKVTVTRSQKRSYGRSTYPIQTTWDNSWKALRPQVPEEFALVTEAGSHQKFPYDSAQFDVELDIEPPIEFKVIRIVNRVPGFVIHCSTMQTSRPKARTLHIRFSLDRNPIIQLFAVMLLVASIGFLGLIFFTAQITNFATSMAAFFLTFWSLRRMLEPLIKTFPTLFDYWMLTICILALLGAGWKVYSLKRPESGV